MSEKINTISPILSIDLNTTPNKNVQTIISSDTSPSKFVVRKSNAANVTNATNLGRIDSATSDFNQNGIQNQVLNQKSNKTLIKETNKTLVKESNNSDANDILKQIRNHLENWGKVSDMNLSTDSNVLHIGENSIGLECFLHYIANDPNFLEKSSNECADVILLYTNESGRLVLGDLINLSKNNNFLSDSEFYQNLYQFNIAVADFIANNNAFTEAKIKTQKNILLGFREFMKHTIYYSNNYMNKYKIINQNMINGNYNLLYLINTISYKQANMGKNIYELQLLYDKFLTAVNQNIGLYEKLSASKIEKISGENNMNTEESVAVSGLVKNLYQKIKMLNNQKELLEKNIKDIESNSTNLEKLASSRVANIGSKLKNK